MKVATENAELTLPDGVGIILAARLCGYQHQGRVTGPTLMMKLCDWGRRLGLRHFFLGGAEGVAERLAASLVLRFPGIDVAGTACPPFRPLTKDERVQLLERVNKTAPDIVWVGLGAPKQEKWMAENVGAVHSTAMIGVGAAFDFLSGNISWAPPWVRESGLEWAYRLLIEPQRMWRRNIDSPIFLLSVMRQVVESNQDGRD